VKVYIFIEPISNWWLWSRKVEKRAMVMTHVTLCILILSFTGRPHMVTCAHLR